MGYFAELAFFLGDNWTVAARYDDKIADYTVKDKEGTRAIEGSAQYTIFDPFSVGAALTFYNDYTATGSVWRPTFSLLAHFDI